MLRPLALSFLLALAFGGDALAFPQQFMLKNTTAAVAPPNPTSPVTSSVFATRLTLSWTSGGGSTTSYKGAYQTGASAPADCNSGTTFTTASTSSTITALASSTQYSFRICASDGTTLSSGVTLTDSTVGPPPDPTGFSATANSSAQITTSWTTGGGTTSHFYVAYQAGATPPASCSAYYASNSPLAVTNLSPSTQYSFRICAVDGGGAFSAGVPTATATTTTAPADPTSLTVSGTGPSSTSLSWTASGGTTVGYWIAYQNGGTAPATCSGAYDTVAANSVTIVGLLPGVQRSFRVCPIDLGATVPTASGPTISATTDAAPAGSYFFSGADESFVVPGGVTSLLVKLWGAGGGGSAGPGGGSGFVTATIAVTPSETLTIIVGEGGRSGGLNCGYVAGTYGGGGSGGLGTYAGYHYQNTSGGGRSALRRGSTELLTAGGGGGGGYTLGGAGGGTVGTSGGGYLTAGATGGSQSAGGAGGLANFYGVAGSNGSQFQGGNAAAEDDCGGGGGGGYYGGGGSNPWGGGGGGSSWVTGSGTTTAGSNATPGGTGDAAYLPGFGVGGSGTNGRPGGYGLVAISW